MQAPNGRSVTQQLDQRHAFMPLRQDGETRARSFPSPSNQDSDARWRMLSRAARTGRVLGG